MSARLIPEGSTPSNFSEIFVRVLSAILLAAAAILLTYWGGWFFCALICVISIILNIEWWFLRGKEASPISLSVDVIAALIAIVATQLGYASYALLVLFAGFCIGLLLRRVANRFLWTAFAPIYIGLPSVSIIWIRQDPEWGLLATTFIFAVVWATDSLAFFAGRAIGGPKLWTQISPKKTWSGFAGGAVAGACVAGLFAIATGLASPIILICLGGFLALAAHAGDILESAMKRAFGAKDASSLIPGHGGLADRVDGLIAALLIAAAIALLRNSDAPGKSLLIWN